jgi:cytochrome c oxidase subunit II
MVSLLFTPAARSTQPRERIHRKWSLAPVKAYNRRPGQEESLLKSWTSLACALATVAAVAAVAAVAEGQPALAAARTIEVSAGDYKFEPAVIEVVEGERIVLQARVTDGKKHGLAIKEMGVKTALPKTGEAMPIAFTAGAPGTYTIACSVYCGNGHKRMRARLVVSARK